MPKLPVISGKKVIKYLLSCGYVEKSCKGSHHNFKRLDGKGFIITIAVHGNDTVREGTLRSVIKFLAMNENKTEEELIIELSHL